MNLKTIIVKNEETNKYTANFESFEDLKSLTSEEVKDFFDHLVKQFVNGEDFEIENKEFTPTTAENGLTYGFVRTFIKEWKQTETLRNEIKSIINN